MIIGEWRTRGDRLDRIRNGDDVTFVRDYRRRVRLNTKSKKKVHVTLKGNTYGNHGETDLARTIFDKTEDCTETRLV